MDQNEANQNCHNSREDQNIDEIMEQEPFSSDMAPMEISEETDSMIIAEDEKTFDSHIQQSGDFQKESETDEIVRRVLDSFNDFQTTTVNNGENDKLLSDASYDHTSVIGKSLTSCAPGNLLPDISKRRIQGMSEHHFKLVNDIRNNSSQILPTMEYSTSSSMTDLKCENRPFYNNKVKTNYLVLKEDDDWDIYLPGMVFHTKSSLESRFSFENAISQNERHVSKNNSVSSVDSDTCQRIKPYVGRRTNHFLSSNPAIDGGTFPEGNEERMLKEVKLFFLANPVRVNPLGDREKKELITTSPYFSRSFALKHDLRLPPPVIPSRELNVTTGLTLEWSKRRAYEIIYETGLSSREFSSYISSMLRGESPGASPHEGYEERELDPSVKLHLDIILSLVGPDIFIQIYEKLTAEELGYPVNF